MFFKRWGISFVVLTLLIPQAGSGEVSEKAKPAGVASVAAANIPLPLPWQEKGEWHPTSVVPSGVPASAEKLNDAPWRQGIYDWLCAQQNPLTGLVESFEGSADPMLKDQAATYDQAVAGMAFLLLGDIARAKKILEFFAARWEGEGFCNFYSTVNGRVGLEWRRHAGPNLWLALLAYQYERMTGDKTFLPLADGLCDWVHSLPHYNGGPAMSDRDELEIPWREIVSTENAIDALAAFQMAEAAAEDPRRRQLISREISEIKRFLKTVALLPDRLLARGYRPFIDGVDKVPALDTTAWFVATVLPENTLYEFGVPAEQLLRAAEQRYAAADQGAEAYDYTDEAEAKKAGRPRMISIEWSAEMASAYWLAAQSSSTLPAQKIEFEQKWKKTLAELDRFEQRRAGRVSYPYASRAGELTFAQGWRTPKERPDGTLAGSVAGTCWRLFAEGWNPLRLEQPAPWNPLPIRKHPLAAAGKKEIEEAAFQPSSLTSEGLTTAAWLNLNAGRRKEARAIALRCIHLYSKQAREQQAKKAADGGLIPTQLLNEKVKQRIFSYAALNDVAACWVILSKIDPSLNPKAAQKIRENFSLAQIWDPAGKFWTPASQPTAQ